MYFVMQKGQEIGPYTIHQLRSLWNSGTITADAEIRSEGDSNWKPIIGVTHLLENNSSSAKAPNPHKPLFDTPIDGGGVKSEKSRGVYIILGLVFGLAGFHNFYAGRYGPGASQFLVLVLLGWLGPGIVINLIWVVIELFAIDHDGQGRKME